jgi:hypothetical protein
MTLTTPSTAVSALRRCRSDLHAAHADAGYAASMLSGAQG